MFKFFQEIFKNCENLNTDRYIHRTYSDERREKIEKRFRAWKEIFFTRIEMKTNLHSSPYSASNLGGWIEQCATCRFKVQGTLTRAHWLLADSSIFFFLSFFLPFFFFFMIYRYGKCGARSYPGSAHDKRFKYLHICRYRMSDPQK